MIKLPTSQSTALTQAPVSGVVGQKAVVDRGTYVSLAESQGLRDFSRRESAFNRIYGSIERAAGVVAAGIGAISAGEGNDGEAGAAAQAENGGPMGAAGVVGASAPVSEQVDTATVFNAMTRQAFPGIANAYDAAKASSAKKLTQFDQTNGLHRQLADQAKYDIEISDALANVPLEEYDEVIAEITKEYIDAANEDLTEGAYNVYYEQMMHYANAKIPAVAKRQADQLFADTTELKTKQLDAAALNGDINQVDAIIAAGVYGDPGVDPEFRVPVWSKTQAESLKIDAYSKVKLKLHRADLNKLGFTGAGEALNAIDENGEYLNYKTLTQGERDSLVQEYQIKDQTYRANRKYKSEEIEQGFYDKEKEYLSQSANFEADFEKQKASMDGYADKRILAWYSSITAKTETRDTDEGLSQLESIRRAVGSGSKSASEGEDAISMLMTGGELSWATGNSARKELYNTPGILAQPDAEDALKPYLSTKEDDGGFTPTEAATATGALNRLYLSPEYQTATDEVKLKMEHNIINDILEPKERNLFGTIFGGSNFGENTAENAAARRASGEIFKDSNGEYKYTFEKEEFGFLTAGDQNKHLETTQKLALSGDYVGVEANHPEELEAMRVATLALYERETNSSLTEDEVRGRMQNHNGVWIIMDSDGTEYFAEPRNAIKNEGEKNEKVTDQTEVVLTRVGAQQDEYLALSPSNNASGKVIPPTRRNGVAVTDGYFIAIDRKPVSLSSSAVTGLKYPVKRGEVAYSDRVLVQPNGRSEWYAIDTVSQKAEYWPDVDSKVKGQYELGGKVVTVDDFDDYKLLLVSETWDQYTAAKEGRGN